MKRLLAFLLALPFAAAPAIAAGFRFRAATHAEGTASAAISMADTEVTGRVDGARARIEIVNSRNPLLPQGDILLTEDGGKTFSLLDTARRTSAAWTPPERAGGSAAARSIVRVQFENPDVQKVAESAGEKISGHATRYFKFRVSYVTAVDVMGSVQKTATNRVEELWTAPDLTEAGFAAWLRKDSALTGNDAFDRQIAAALSARAGDAVEARHDDDLERLERKRSDRENLDQGLGPEERLARPRSSSGLRRDFGTFPRRSAEAFRGRLLPRRRRLRAGAALNHVISFPFVSSNVQIQAPVASAKTTASDMPPARP